MVSQFSDHDLYHSVYIILSSPVVTIYTTSYNIKKFYVLPAQSMNVDRGTN